MNNESNENNENMTNAPDTTTDVSAEARRLIGELRSWGLVLRDAQPPAGGLSLFFGPSERIASHAWDQFTKKAKQLEAMFAPADDGQATKEGDA